MLKTWSLVVFVPLTLLVLPAATPAQETGPEALEASVGTWEAEDGAWAECDWFGESAVLCLQAWTTDSGEERQGVFVTAWDEASERYRVDRFYSTGYTDSGFVWIDGNEWVYVFRGPNGGLIRADQVWADDSVEYEWYRSVRGGPWEPTGGQGSMMRTEASASLFEH